ncbi:MAG: ABC transporter family substrate-binding protein [Microbacteriaceae bacterium]|nr:ABC transporter family substrate-binding protein [Microbacteriaceae bacterium]
MNDRTSYGNSPANSSVLQAVNSSFNRYDDESNLVVDPSFGSYQLLSNDPLTVKYTIAHDVTWSDGVPVDAADLMLAWVANSGALNTQAIDDAAYRDVETGRYTTPLPDDVVYFDGTTSEGLHYVTAVPEIGDDGRSLTLTWDSYIVDWPLLLHVGLPAHVVASHALGIPLSPDLRAEDGKVDPDRLSDARNAKEALIAAIRGDDTATLSLLANFWNSGFDVETMPDDDSLFVSTGPYTITGFVPTESVTLTANGRYRGAHSPVFETVEIRFLSDPLDQIAGLADGTLDVIVPRPNSEVMRELIAVPGATILQVPGGTYEHLDLTFTDGKNATFQDARVREAFLMTVPIQRVRDDVLESPFADFSDRSSIVFLPDAPGYSESVETNGSARFLRPNVEGAKSLLAEAGVVSPPVCIMFDPSNPKRVQEFQLIAEAAALAGFVVTNCSGPDWRGLLGTPGTYDASIFAWSSANLSVAGLQSIFGTGGIGNLNGYSNPEVDRLLSELAVTPDLDAQDGLRIRLDTVLFADAYGLPLYQDTIVAAHNGTLEGVKPATLARGMLWNVWDWAPFAVATATPTPVK